MDERDIIGEMKRAGVDVVASIPCDKARDLFFALPNKFRHIGLTREEDGVGIAAGAYMGGARPLVAIQSSGIGNMLNAILSLSSTFGLPLPILASWRGQAGEVIPAQIPFNRPLPAVLAAAGIPYTIISGPDRACEIGDAIAGAFAQGSPHVILVPPLCIRETPATAPVITNAPSHAALSRQFCYERNWKNPSMTRYEAIRVIAGAAGDAACISNIGVPSKELYAAKDRNLNFYMLGSYTQASAIGLGVATTCPDRQTIVIDGDGSLLGSSILPVIAAAAPPSLTIATLDNGVFGSTGNQPRPGHDTADLALMARGAGFKNVSTVHEAWELEAAIGAAERKGPTFIHVRILPGNSSVPNIPLSPGAIRDRFMEALRLPVKRPDSS
jgi:sulfopyruvate decarboxylase subunit beta